jgi:hypothetical protein
VRWDENDIRQNFSGNDLQTALQTYQNAKSGDVLGTNPPGGSQAVKGSEIVVAVKK